MSEPKHFSGALAKHPDLAKQIGFLMADYAALETMLFELFVTVTPGNPTVTRATFFSMRSVNNKTKLITDLVVSYPPVLRTAFKKIDRRMKRAAQRRTEVAHVLFLDGESGPMRVHLTGSEARVTPLNSEFINRTTDQFRILGTDIVTLIGVMAGGNIPRLIARSKEANGALDALLPGAQSPPPPSSLPSEAERAASVDRLGLTEYLNWKVLILDPKGIAPPNGYRLCSFSVWYRP